ncbi:MAG: Coenzyme F420 hydrogenase/dehydrogenase, beta subunit C-terminal domain [Thermoplasmata archaeon]
MSNEMYLARSSDEQIRDKAERGGAVTSLLKYTLVSGMVDAVLTIKAREGNRYAGVPALIDDPDGLLDTAGSLHCTTPNIARFVREYLEEIPEEKIGVVCKPCDAKAIIELAKREQIDRENLILIGLNCTGTISPVTAKEMMKEEFDVDPNDVIREDFDEGDMTITLEDGGTKTRELSELEEKGYGRRENCKRCDTNIPRMADIACGKWGTDGEDTTFIEVCSDDGSELIEKAMEEDFIRAEVASERNIHIREEKDKAELERVKEERKHDFERITDSDRRERLDYWMEEFNKCIKCYGCRDACPLCYCEDCILEPDRGFVESGEIPPDTLFPLTRLSHVADSCVNCGQCQEACPMDLPLSKLYSLLNDRLSEMFDYRPGEDLDDEPPLKTFDERELKMDDTFVDVSSLSTEKQLEKK